MICGGFNGMVQNTLYWNSTGIKCGRYSSRLEELIYSTFSVHNVTQFHKRKCNYFKNKIIRLSKKSLKYNHKFNTVFQVSIAIYKGKDIPILNHDFWRTLGKTAGISYFIKKSLLSRSVICRYLFLSIKCWLKEYDANKFQAGKHVVSSWLSV